MDNFKTACINITFTHGSNHQNAGEITREHSESKGDVTELLNTTPSLITMNSQTSQHQSFQEPDQELSTVDYVKAAALIIGARASIAIGFTLIATCYAADAAFKSVFRKGGRHFPR